MAERFAGRVRAPEFPRDAEWVGAEPGLRLADLRGRIVLLDFWTFCCINCQHVLPELRTIEARFRGTVEVLGIHSPKFVAERDTAALRAACQRLGVGHPTANDREMAIWQAYAVRAWPTLMFIDPSGRIIGRHEGEFDPAAVIRALEAMVAEFTADGTLQSGPGLGQEAGMPNAGTLRFPGKAIASPDGYVVSDTGHHRVLLLDHQGQVTATFGGPEPGMVDGDAGEARFRDPQGLAWFGSELVVADAGNHALRAIDVLGGRLRTLAGDGRQGSLWSSPWDVATVGDRVLVAMAGNHRLVQWQPQKPDGEILAGCGREGLRNGPAASAEFAQPSAVAVDGAVAYVADSETSAIRAMGLATGTVGTLVGEGLFEFGDRDGTAAEVRLQHPLGICFHDGMLFLADSYNHRIKRLDPRTRACTTLAGGGRPGMADAVAGEALFWEPGGISVAHGRLLVADTNNHALRLVDPQTGAVTTVGR